MTNMTNHGRDNPMDIDATDLKNATIGADLRGAANILNSTNATNNLHG